TLSISDLHIAISIYIHVLHYGNPFSVRLCTVSLSACYPVSSYSMRYKFYLSDITVSITYTYATLCEPLIRHTYPTRCWISTIYCPKIMYVNIRQLSDVTF